MVEALHAIYGIVLSGMLFATWFYAFQIRKSFRGGIFWNAWRVIATSPLFFMASQLVGVYESIYGSTFAVDAIVESLLVVAVLLTLLGFYLFYKGWNPKIATSGG
jgi:hypothetical protein